MPDGHGYLWRPALLPATMVGGEPSEIFAIGLGCEIRHADRLVYSSGSDLGSRPSSPRSWRCRICGRVGTPCLSRSRSSRNLQHPCRVASLDASNTPSALQVPYASGELTGCQVSTSQGDGFVHRWHAVHSAPRPRSMCALVEVFRLAPVLGQVPCWLQLVATSLAARARARDSIRSAGTPRPPRR